MRSRSRATRWSWPRTAQTGSPASPADPDAIVLDVAMPVVDGIEMCRRLRHEGNGLPILMLTARESVTDRVAGLDAGADDYLVKPFALEELLARLGRSCAAATAQHRETCWSSPTSRSTPGPVR